MGKLIGAFFGFLLTGNLFGALLGLFVGHLFDRGFKRHWQAGWFHFQLNSEQQKEARRCFFRTTFMVMGHIAKADGRVSPDEIRAAQAVMHRMRLSAEQKKRAVHYFSLGKQADFNLQQTLDEFMQVCGHQRLLLRLFVDIQVQAAMADGGMDAIQQQIIMLISQRIGFTPFFYQHQAYQQAHQSQQGSQQYAYRPTVDALSEAYTTLEIESTASNHEVKKAYRRQMGRHHPDKLMAQGLPEEMIKLATDKTQKIQKAYERIRKARGF